MFKRLVLAYSFSHDKMLEPRLIEPVNDTNSGKVKALSEDLEKRGWSGRPVLVYEGVHGWMAVTGSHRIMAARLADVEVPVVVIDEDAVNFEDDEGNTLGDLVGTGDDHPLAKFLKEAGDEKASRLVEAEIEANDEGD